MIISSIKHGYQFMQPVDLSKDMVAKLHSKNKMFRFHRDDLEARESQPLIFTTVEFDESEDGGKCKQAIFLKNYPQWTGIDQLDTNSQVNLFHYKLFKRFLFRHFFKSD